MPKKTSRLLLAELILMGVSCASASGPEPLWPDSKHAERTTAAVPLRGKCVLAVLASPFRGNSRRVNASAPIAPVIFAA